MWLAWQVYLARKVGTSALYAIKASCSSTQSHTCLLIAADTALTRQLLPAIGRDR